MSEHTATITRLITEIKPLIERELNITFGVNLVSGHVCVCKPAFNHVILGEQFIFSVCEAHNCDLYTALLLVLTHEGLHVTGLRHDAKSRKMGFYSHTLRDTHSPKIALKIANDEEIREEIERQESKKLEQKEFLDWDMKNDNQTNI
jgi:hypothetical protein